MPYNNTNSLSNFHLHLTGAQDVDSLRLVANTANIPLDDFEPLDNAISFDSYNYWAAAKEITSNELGLMLSIQNVLAHEQRAGVTYVELTINPAGMLRRGMSIPTLLEQINLGYQYGQSIGIQLKVKFGVNRKDGKESISSVISVFEETPETQRFGIDLNGDERTHSTDEFVPDFRAIARQGVATTIHAGEYPGTSGSLRAALNANPTRIGHAIAVKEEPDGLKRLSDSGTVIEVALTSNLMLGAVACLEEHPLIDFIEHNIPVVFGTDDPGLFGNSMTDEMTLLGQMGLNIDEITTLTKRANKMRDLT